MKNKLFVAVVIVLVVSIICLLAFPLLLNKEKATPQNVSNSFKKPFDAAATIKMKDLVLQADINKTAQNCMVMTVKSPKTLKDMQFIYDGADIKINYKGFTVTLDENSKVVTNVMNIIVKAIDAAASESGINVALENNAVIVSGQSDVGKFKAVLDKKTGSLLSINVPSLDFECNFDV